MCAPRVVVVLLVAAVAAACARRPADPVAALLADLETAAEARDAERFATLLTEPYRDEHGLGRDETRQQLKRWFAGYESVALEVYGIEVARRDGKARVRCIVDFAGRARRVAGLEGLLPPAATYRFTLDVTEEGGAWRVSGAAYEPVLPAGPGAERRGIRRLEFA
jgi:type IV pilus biogenesis protein CpaD/CtpE